MERSRVTTPPSVPKQVERSENSQENSELPREILREVASNLKSLARILPYAEYAAIVRRIAEVRWRCELRLELVAARGDEMVEDSVSRSDVALVRR